MIYRSPKEPSVPIMVLLLFCGAAFAIGLFSGKFIFQKNNLPEESQDTLHSLLLRITVLEDSLDNSLWHLNDISKFKDSVLLDKKTGDTLE